MTAAETLRVLIADDHEPSRELLDRLLRARPGVDVVATARDGLQAVSLTLDCRPNLVFMDLSMPELNGLEATRRIKSADPRIKVVVVTVHEGRRYRLEAEAAGADAFLLKKDLPGQLDSALLVAGPRAGH
jgi:DNA-binding NarL/FixJ family response regulator